MHQKRPGQQQHAHKPLPLLLVLLLAAPAVQSLL
jgi:hypothetical protein